MPPGSPPLPSKRPRNPPGPSASNLSNTTATSSSSSTAAAARAKRKRAQEADDDDAIPLGDKKRKSAANNSKGSGSGLGPNGAGAGGNGGGNLSGRAGEAGDKDEPPKSRLDFNALPASALRTFILAQNMCPHITPSPYSDLPAPLPQTLYTNPSPPPVARNSRPERVAILADIQAFHEVMANQAKDVWDKTVVAGTGGVREGEVVTSFLYACKVGNRVLKIVPPSS